MIGTILGIGFLYVLFRWFLKHTFIGKTIVGIFMIFRELACIGYKSIMKLYKYVHNLSKKLDPKKEKTSQGKGKVIDLKTAKSNK